MKINDIITSGYTYFLGECKNNMVISEGRTAKDVLNDIMLQTLKHFKNKDVTWEEGYNYIADTFHLELFFSKRRKENFLLMDDVAGRESIIAGYYKSDDD